MPNAHLIYEFFKNKHRIFKILRDDIELNTNLVTSIRGVFQHKYTIICNPR